MKGDFSRWTFDPSKHYGRVLSLQGRVFLDADSNEAHELQLWHLRKLMQDLIGPHAGPGTGFEITPVQGDFSIAAGSYYVNGILCENDTLASYLKQPFLPKPEALSNGSFIAYLDVWERLVTYIEDEDRSPAELGQTIREVALGGPDTAARSQVVWQVRLLPFVSASPPTNDEKSYQAFLKQLKDTRVVRTSVGKLKARARKPKGADQPCPTNPDSRYRGPENQLYRVEVHNKGIFLADGSGAPKATFKWSRENGSVVFPIRSIEGATVTLETLGRDERLGLKPGDLVEVVDDRYVLENRAEPLLTVKSMDPETFVVELGSAPASSVGSDPKDHPILRRWEGTAEVSRNPDPATDGYLTLEQGVEIYFNEGEYRTGDYWIMPARTATGDVEWPGPATDPQLVEPHGIVHGYAPLAYLAVTGGSVTVALMRRSITVLWK